MEERKTAAINGDECYVGNVWVLRRYFEGRLREGEMRLSKGSKRRNLEWLEWLVRQGKLHVIITPYLRAIKITF